MEALLEEVRNYLDITWEDDPGDKKLLGILKRGQQYLEKRAGGPLDFTKEGDPKALLFEYARYVRSDALDEFQGNYLHELLVLRFAGEVERYHQAESPDPQ